MPEANTFSTQSVHFPTHETVSIAAHPYTCQPMNSPTFPHTNPSNYLLNKIFTLFIHAKSKNNRFPLIFGFVTIRDTNGYKHPSKRCPFTLQKGVFYTSKGHLLPRKRVSFAMQKTID